MLKSFSFAFVLVAAGALAGCGDDDDGTPLVSAPTVDFGLTNCGTTAVARQVTIANPGSSMFTFTTSLGKGASSPYTIVPDAGVLLPGQQVQVMIVSSAIPAVSAVTPDLYSDTLSIETSVEGQDTQTIELKQTARGAILGFSAATVDFPTTQIVATSSQQALTVTNSGNAPADVTVAGTGGFTFAPASGTAAATTGLAGNIQYVASNDGADAGTLALASSSALCAPLPTLSASGRGTFKGSGPTKIAFVDGPGVRKGGAALFVTVAGGYLASLGSNESGLRGTGLTFNTGALGLVRKDDGSALSNVVEVTGGRAGACARSSDNDVYCWGNVELRKNREVLRQPFARLLGSATAVGMGYGVRCTSPTTGNMSCATNLVGNLGNAANPASWNVTGAVALAMHGGGGYATLADGTVTSFGSNLEGERGALDGNSNPVTSGSAPTPVSGLTGVAQVITSGGRSHANACARKTDGTVWCWGHGKSGRNGDGTTSNRNEPVQVLTAAATPLTDATQITGDHGHRCAISTSLGVVCWGHGRDGSMGRANNTTDENVFAQPTDPAITDAISIAATRRGFCALRTGGTITCWGSTPLSANATHSDFVGFVP